MSDDTKKDIYMDTSITCKELFEIFVNSLRIPRHIFAETSEDLSEIDFHFRKDLIPSFDYAAMFKEMTRHVSSSYPVDYEDSFGAHYIVLKYDALSNDEYEIWGPLLYKSASEQTLLTLMEKHSIPASHFEDLRQFFFRITLIKDVLSFNRFIDQIFSLIEGQHVSLHNEKPDFSKREEEKQNIDIMIPKSVAAFSALEARYEVERKLMDAVTRGSIRDAVQAYNLFMGFKLEQRTPDPVRNTKNMLITVNTLLRKAAEKAYVHPLHLDNISTRMTKEIEGCRSVIELENLCETMIRKYCLLVSSHSRAEYSPVIRDVMRYIDFHYHEKVTLQSLSEQFCVSKNHLSHIFHQEVGQTLTDYINTQRIDRAILLLNTSGDSMPVIAEQCGFSDANYFTRIFRKYKNMSPLQYRQMMNAKEPPGEN